MTTPTVADRIPSRLSWWHLAILIVLSLLAIVVSGLIAIRANGESQLRQVKADLRAQGLASSYEEWRAALPARDADGARELMRLVAAFPTNTKLAKVVDESFVQDWITGKSEGPPPLVPRGSGTTALRVEPWRSATMALRAELAPELAAMERFLPVLRSSTASFASYVSLPASASAAAEFLILPSAQDLFPALLHSRGIATHLRAQALLAEDPTVPLSDLDRLCELMSADSYSLISGVIWVLIDSIRDQTYLSCAVRGTLSDHQLEHWHKNIHSGLDVAVHSLAGERAIYGTMIDSDLLHSAKGKRAIGIGNDSWMDIAMTPWWWAVQPGGSAFYQRHMFNLEIAVRTATASAMLHASWLNPVAALFCPAPDSSTFREFLHRRRYTRGAALIITANRRNPITTATAAEAIIAPLLDGGPTGIHLGIEMLAPGRFRIAIDPSCPWPGWADPTNYERSRMLGAPADKIPRGILKPLREGIDFELPQPASPP